MTIDHPLKLDSRSCRSGGAPHSRSAHAREVAAVFLDTAPGTNVFTDKSLPVRLFLLVQEHANREMIKIVCTDRPLSCSVNDTPAQCQYERRK